jgi:PadR family transcriptional regulator PadR
MGADAPRMTVATLSVLSAMLAAPTADWYGLELARHAGLQSGTIYPILARLERLGWLVSHWESIDPATEGRPKRRIYKLSGEGERAARDAVEDALAPIARAASPRITRPDWRTA